MDCATAITFPSLRAQGSSKGRVGGNSALVMAIEDIFSLRYSYNQDGSGSGLVNEDSLQMARAETLLENMRRFSTEMRLSHVQIVLEYLGWTLDRIRGSHFV